MYTLSELNSAILENDDFEGWEELSYTYHNSDLVINDRHYKVNVIDEKTGGEGYDGNTTYVVFSVTGSDGGIRNFKKTGLYRSHYGNDWDGPFIEVAPVEKTITVFEEKKTTYGQFSKDDLHMAISSGDFYWGELGYSSAQIVVNGETYETQPVDDIGGEGQGEYAAVLFRVAGRLFRKEGYYASHYGTDWDGEFEEVEPYEKTVTSYRPV